MALFTSTECNKHNNVRYLRSLSRLGQKGLLHNGIYLMLPCARIAALSHQSFAEAEEMLAEEGRELSQENLVLMLTQRVELPLGLREELKALGHLRKIHSASIAKDERWRSKSTIRPDKVPIAALLFARDTELDFHRRMVAEIDQEIARLKEQSSGDEEEEDEEDEDDDDDGNDLSLDL